MMKRRLWLNGLLSTELKCGASAITGKYDGGVFCKLENELDCLCSYLPEQNALDFHIGERVVIVIRKYNYERKLVFGRILARR